MSLLDTVTGGQSGNATSDLEKALQAIQGVQTPTADEMKYQVQKLVQAGTITPAQAQTFLQNPNAMLGENIDQTGTKAQQDAIAGMMAAANQGGLNAVDQEKMGEITRGLNTQEKGANDAVLQGAAQRGTLTGGETIAAQLQNNQNADMNANQLGLGTAANALNARLSELTSAGQMGQGLQGQENTQANTVAEATNAINQFNAAQQQGEANLNTQASNSAQEMNLANLQGINNSNTENANQYSQYQVQLPQQIYQDEMSKANAEAGIYGQQANQATGQGEQNVGLLGTALNLAVPMPGLASAAGSSSGTGSGGTGYLSPGAGAGGSTQTLASAIPFANAGSAALSLFDQGGKVGPSDMFTYLAEQGGHVPGKAKVQGNSPRNDTVPAMLSPGEVVIPRTVAQNPRPDHVMEFLNRMRKPKPEHHPRDIANVLNALNISRNT